MFRIVAHGPHTAAVFDVVGEHQGHEAVFAEVGPPYFSIGPLEFHVYVVWVPPYIDGNDGEGQIDESAIYGGILAVCSSESGVLDADEGVEAQQNRMAHVRVAVVHNFHVRCGVRRNQCAGGGPVPLQCGGSVLAFPLRGGVPHVGPQVELVPGGNGPVLLGRAAVLGGIRTQSDVCGVATEFLRQLFLREYDIQVFFQSTEFRIRQETGRNQGDVMVHLSQVFQPAVFTVSQYRIKGDEFSDCGHVVSGT
ncbi:Uncharacterised protein [Akkermansia muciniphila]|uniref:Uncharacterized protein n=1 Tax=Akkermansia muciniphila TaxID=239935 RepID=A0A6N2TDB3_9BACT